MRKKLLLLELIAICHRELCKYYLKELIGTLER